MLLRLQPRRRRRRGRREDAQEIDIDPASSLKGAADSPRNSNMMLMTTQRFA
jgi:hypothetical protein